MAKMSTAKKIEDQLLDENQQLESLGAELLSAPNGDGIFMDENGNFTRAESRATFVEGAEAAKLLGIPARVNNQLYCGDHRKIAKKFKPLLDEYIQTERDPNKEFWKNIKIRVWNVKNIGQKINVLNPDYKKGENSMFVGAPYIGDIYDGTALEGFLPNIERSARHSEFKVQLLSVRATEEMIHAAR